MLLPSIFGERLLDDWMDFPRMDFPDIDRKLYGKHAANVMKTDVLLKNIVYVKKYVSQIKIVLLAQVLDFEDEISRATDVKKAQNLTKSKSVGDFKSDFCKMKVEECRKALERHHLDVTVLWTKNPPDKFSFVEQNGSTIKL